MQLEVGAHVRINAQSLAPFGATGVVVSVHRNDDGEPINAQVQIDASDERCWLHRSMLLPIQEAARV